jgi:histidinol phosphatase-like PHP family hydrolase
MDDYHIHTKATDGNADPAEVIKLARELKVETIAFTEHISKNPTYDWFKLRDAIYGLDCVGVNVLVGVEAKVLNASGDLNVDGEVFASADLVLGACHGDCRVEWLLESECDIIAHPQITLANVERFVDCKKVLEINSKHRLPYEILDKLVLDSSNVFSFGSDTHQTDDFVAAQNYFALVLKRYPQIRLFDAKHGLLKK